MLFQFYRRFRVEEGGLHRESLSTVVEHVVMHERVNLRCDDGVDLGGAKVSNVLSNVETGTGVLSPVCFLREDTSRSETTTEDEEC